jgi:hypothetical protein
MTIKESVALCRPIYAYQLCPSIICLEEQTVVVKLIRDPTVDDFHKKSAGWYNITINNINYNKYSEYSINLDSAKMTQ